MIRGMTKSVDAIYANNKDADPRSLISVFVIRCLNGIMPRYMLKIYNVQMLLLLLLFFFFLLFLFLFLFYKFYVVCKFFVNSRLSISYCFKYQK